MPLRVVSHYHLRMVLFEALALFGGLKDIFVYNRDLFMFNRGINQTRIHQTQKMRIEQVLLFREDIRDLFDLTMGKMKQYLVVNTLTLAFCMGFFYEGRMPFDTPSWLFWLWGMSLGTAILFLFMSVWFAIYALITAQTFAVRLLTQWLRLPVPAKDDIAKAAATAAEFEKKEASSLLRVPLVPSTTQSGGASSSSGAGLPPPAGGPNPAGSMRRSNSTGNLPSTRTSEEQEAFPRMVNPVLEHMFATEYKSFVEHFHLFRYLQEHWAGYDAYARVCMVVGSAQLISTIGYMGIAWYVTDHGRWGGSVFTVLLLVFGVVHTRMNLLLSRKELIALVFFQVAGPVVGCVVALLQYVDAHHAFTRIAACLVPVAFLFHLLTVAFYLSLGSERTGALPTKYSTVVSIDVLGLWEEGPEGDFQTANSEDENDQDLWDVNMLAGWQKKWLKATKREAPVSVLIPQSVDMTHAEKERYLRNSTKSRGNAYPEVVSRRYEAASAESETSRQELPATKYSSTLPWVTFRQAGAVTILLWLIAIGVGIAVAALGRDIAGWDSDPSNHQAAVGTSLWSPNNWIAPVSTGHSPSQPRGLLSGFGDGLYRGFLERVDRDLPVTIRALRAVTSEGLHIVVRHQGELVRFLIDHELKLVHYEALETMRQFSTITAASINEKEFPEDVRAPWCSPTDIVTMIEVGTFRDCNKLSTVWTVEDRRISHQFIGAVGRYALNKNDHAVYRFQIHRKFSSLRTDIRFSVPASLVDVVDIAKNEFVLVVMSSDGLLAVWNLQRDDVLRKGVREIPQRSRYVWKSVVGAGGKALVVLGEHRDLGLYESFYIQDVLSLSRIDRFH